MTRQEQLKIYAAYLPYGLIVKKKFSRYSPTKIEVMSIDDLKTFGIFKIFKPILYDLSYLTKEIEHEGEKFVPMLKLAKIESEIFEWLDDDKLGNPIIGIEDTDFHMGSMTYAHTRRFEFDYEIGLFVVNLYDEGACCEKDLIRCEEVCFSNRLLIDKLLEWHFNVFGLPAGDFIEKSTIKTESNE